MRPTEQQMGGLSITPSIYERLVRWGWIDVPGRAKRWYDHQREDHNAQFEEPRERKVGPKKFTKETR